MEHVATWDDLRVLLAVHRHASFLGAGRSLGTSTSTVARRIGALEQSVGRPLVHRTTAGTTLEPEALELVALAEEVEARLASARREPERAADALAGTVRITSGEGFAGPLTRALSELRRKHPAIEIELVIESRHADLARRAADLGLRTGRSESAVLVERRLGVLRFAPFAAPSYVERRLGTPRLRAGDFARLEFVGYEGALARLPQHAWLVGQGARRFPFRSGSDQALLEATLGGQGIAMLAEPIARDEPGLVQLATDAEPPRVPVFLVVHRDRRRVPRIRAVASAIERAFRSQLG